MTPEEAKQIARDIVDEACLGEAFARNGTIAALHAAIAEALVKAGRPLLSVNKRRVLEAMVAAELAMAQARAAGIEVIEVSGQ